MDSACSEVGSESRPEGELSGGVLEGSSGRKASRSDDDVEVDDNVDDDKSLGRDDAGGESAKRVSACAKDSWNHEHISEP